MTDTRQLLDDDNPVAPQGPGEERARARARLRRYEVGGVIAALAILFSLDEVGLGHLHLLPGVLFYALLIGGMALSKRARAALERKYDAKLSTALLGDTGIEQLLDDDLRAALQGVEQERLKARTLRRQILMVGSAIGSSLVALTHVKVEAQDATVVAAAMVLGLGWGVHMLVEQRLAKSVEKSLRENVGPLLTQRIDERLALTPHSGILRSEFQASGLYAKTPDRYRTEDLVAGVLGQTAVRFADVHAERKIDDKYKDLFRGVLFVADFHKHFAGSVLVKPDLSEGKLGGLGRAVQRGSVGGKQRVELEDSEFENLFAVYADDETEARYLLTPDMMRRFVELTGTLGSFRASFHDNQLYIALPRSRGLFEIDMSRSLLDLVAVRAAATDIHIFRGLIEALELNTRIWTRE